MNMILLTLLFIVLVVVVPLLTGLFVLNIYGVTNQKTGFVTVSGKVMLTFIATMVVYLFLLFYFGGKAIDHYFPLETHKEMVCEVKTTYERKGL